MFRIGRWHALTLALVGLAAGVDWRLTLCMLVGVTGALLAALLGEFLGSPSYRPVQGIAAAGRQGVGSVLVQAAASGFVCCLPAFAIVSGVGFLANQLAGLPGLGLAALGYLGLSGAAGIVFGCTAAVELAGTLSRAGKPDPELEAFWRRQWASLQASLGAAGSVGSTGSLLCSFVLQAALWHGLRDVSVQAELGARSGWLLGGGLAIALAGSSLFSALTAPRRSETSIGWPLAVSVLAAALMLALLGSASGPFLVGLLAGSAFGAAVLAILLSSFSTLLRGALAYVESGYGGGAGSAVHTALVESERLSRQIWGAAAPIVGILLKLVLVAALWLGPGQALLRS